MSTTSSTPTQAPPTGAQSRCGTCGEAMRLRFTAPRDHLKPAEGQPFEAYWCERCDWGQIWPRPTAEQRTSFYAVDDYYTHTTDAVWPDQPKSWLDRIRVHVAWRLDRGRGLDLRRIISQLDVPAPTLCEIGCGGGDNMSALREAGFAVTGIEPDDAARKLALEQGLDVHAGEAEVLPAAIAGRQFDAVVMSHVLEHCIDIEQALQSVRSILRPGGLFIVEVPNCSCLGFRASAETWPWTDAPRHLSFFTPKSLAMIVERAGFVIQEQQFQGFCRQFSNEWITAERNIWSAMYEADGAPTPPERPNFKARAWKLLGRMLVARPEAKYDSIRLVTYLPPKA